MVSQSTGYRCVQPVDAGKLGFMVNSTRRGRRLVVLAEALARSLRAWAIVKFSAAPRLSAVLGKPVPLPASEPVTNVRASSAWPEIADIIWAHQLLERATGNRLTCLMRSLSARDMLDQKGIGAVLVLGAGRGGERSDGKLSAHAWVVVEGATVLGGKQMAGQAPVAAFVRFDRKGQRSCDSPHAS